MSDAEARRRRADAFLTTGEEYHRLRPGYPEDAVSWMLPAGALDVLDLGAGTGRLTDALVERGLAVVAVDPSAAMLAVLGDRHPGVRRLVGSGEGLPLPDASLDAVVVGQAWHWVDPVATAAEVARVLRPGGTLAMAWNVPVIRPGWQEEFEVVQRGRRGIDLAADDEVDAPLPGFGPREEFVTRWSREVAAEDYVLGYTTHSLFLVADPAEQERRLTRWRELVSGAGPTVTQAFTTQVWRYRLAP